jgi:hypothetical protein
MRPVTNGEAGYLELFVECSGARHRSWSKDVRISLSNLELMVEVRSVAFVALPVAGPRHLCRAPKMDAS